MMTENKILITNIQRFSLHDGPGIRTSVFLKGCNIHCPWCSNPENLSCQIQAYLKNGQKGIFGKYLTIKELYTEIMKDKVFYLGNLSRFNIMRSNDIELLPGGVTFSGGECLIQIQSLEPLLRQLNTEHIHITIETSLFIPERNLNIAIKYIDFFYIDIKIMDSD